MFHKYCRYKHKIVYKKSDSVLSCRGSVRNTHIDVMCDIALIISFDDNSVKSQKAFLYNKITPYLHMLMSSSILLNSQNSNRNESRLC